MATRSRAIKAQTSYRGYRCGFFQFPQGERIPDQLRLHRKTVRIDVHPLDLCSQLGMVSRYSA
jgi:hypothetical protein